MYNCNLPNKEKFSHADCQLTHDLKDSVEGSQTVLRIEKPELCYVGVALHCILRGV